MALNFFVIVSFKKKKLFNLIFLYRSFLSGDFPVLKRITNEKFIFGCYNYFVIFSIGR